MPSHDTDCPRCGAAIGGDAGTGADRCAYCNSPLPRPAPAPGVAAAGWASPAGPGGILDQMIRGMASVASSGATVTVTTTGPGGETAYKVNGRTYRSLDEMPADVRAVVERMQGAIGGGAFPGLPDGAPPPGTAAHAELAALMDTVARTAASGTSASVVRDAEVSNFSVNASVGFRRDRATPLSRPAAGRAGTSTRTVIVTVIVTVLAMLAVLAFVAAR